MINYFYVSSVIVFVMYVFYMSYKKLSIQKVFVNTFAYLLTSVSMMYIFNKIIKLNFIELEHWISNRDNSKMIFKYFLIAFSFLIMLFLFLKLINLMFRLISNKIKNNIKK